MATKIYVDDNNNDDPYSQFEAITPHASNNISFLTRAIYVGVTGDVTLIDNYGTTILFKAVPAGTVLRVRSPRVNATGTTATTMVAMA